jgi:uncharacterized membrane-anchored protein
MDSRNMRAVTVTLWSACAALLLCAPPSAAQDADSDPAAEASVEEESAAGFDDSSLRFTQGDVEISDGLARLSLGDRYRYLGPEDTARVLVEAWGNPPSNPTLGMVFPAGMGPLDDDSWAVVIEYQDDGYVSDDDAKDLDYAEILEGMQEAVSEANEERREAGYGSVELVDWAEPPHYDAASHKVYWAKRLAFEGSDQHTLNYDIRVLGRRGVLVLSAVGSMAQLEAIRTGMQDVLGIVEFNPGHRYADFDPSADRVATYGIGALIAGGVAAKAGLFAKLGAFLLAFKKVIFIAGAGLVAVIARLFRRSSNA